MGAFQGHLFAAFQLYIPGALNTDNHSRIHPSQTHPHMYHLHFIVLFPLFFFCFFSLSFSFNPLLLWYTHLWTHTHSKAPKHKKSRPQLRQAISLTIQSVFFPMMFPIGTGRRKSDLLPHRAHAVALIWKMISVLFEPINIILVSPVNDTFLPSIVDLTEEEMSVREEVKKRRRRR